MNEETVAQAEESKQIRYSVEIWMWADNGSERLFKHDIHVEQIDGIQALAMLVKP